MLEYVISHDGVALRHASKRLITDDLCKSAVQQNGWALKYVPKDYLTDEICRMAVSNNGMAIEYVPYEFVTAEICDMAVSENGLALEYVPDKYMTDGLVHKAIKFYYCPIPIDWLSFISIDRDELRERARLRGRKLGEIYGKYYRYPIAYVPEALITQELLIEAVKYSPHCLRAVPRKLIKKEVALAAVSVEGATLYYVPKNIISKVMIETAISNNPLALEFVPQRKITDEICQKCFEGNPLAIRFIPKEYLSASMCEMAFERNIQAFKCIPEEYKTFEMCLKVIRQCDFEFNEPSDYEREILFDELPEEMRNRREILDAVLERADGNPKDLLSWNQRIILKNEQNEKYSLEQANLINPLHEDTIQYLEDKESIFKKKKIVAKLASDEGQRILELTTLNNADLEIPLEPFTPNSLPVEYGNGDGIVHDFTDNDVSAQKIYYITDLHIEHQVAPIIETISFGENKDSEQDNDMAIYTAVNDFLDQKIKELIDSAEDTEGILLVGGDVAYSQEITTLFYKKLSFWWKGKVVFILGNHELWDGHPTVQNSSKVRSVDEIISDYRNITVNEQLDNVRFLENDVYIIYKNRPASSDPIIREKQILEASIDELTDLCSKSSMIILGGVGFSGFNTHYNAELGLYRSTITSKERDRELSERFCKVYNKLLQCAGDKSVVVLTHTPVYNWTTEPCNSNWIYVNGHTHHNSINLENKAIILSDNQIGYTPKRWKLNAFTISGWYDPFEDYEDGIYEITSEQFKDFNIGRGIECNGCNHQGRIYVLKRDGFYMFLLKTWSSLCLLVGGQRKKLEQNDIEYYYNNMSLYGQAIREAIKPYEQILEAISKEVKKFGGTGKVHGCIVDISFFSHIYVNPFDGKLTSYWALNMYSRLPYDNIQTLLEEREPSLLNRFKIEQSKKTLPLIEKNMTKKVCKESGATIPEWVFGTEMYEPSKIMRNFQYVWDQKVIRNWNEDILNKLRQSHTIENNKINGIDSKDKLN